MTFKIFERRDTPTNKGIPLHFIVRIKNKTYKINTGYHCKEGSWDQHAQSVITSGKNKDTKGFHINGRLKRASIELENILMKHSNISEIRKVYRQYLNKKEEVIVASNDTDIIIKTWDEFLFEKYQKTKNKEFFMLVEKILFDHKNDWATGYIKGIRSLKATILDFEPEFQIENLSESWWHKFSEFVLKRGNTNNTLFVYSQRLRVLIREFNLMGYRVENFKINWKRVATEKQGLEWDKVLKIRDSDLSGMEGYTIEDSRKLWLAGALTGRRWSEISQAKPHNFYESKNQWRYKNIGKGQKLIDIPLLPEAVEFFKSVNFTLPKVDGRHVNRDIKLICKHIGLKAPILKITPITKSEIRREALEEWQTVTFHTGRHSYAQHIVELSAGKPHAEKFVSFMLGHASFQTTWRYLNRSASSNEQMFEEIIKEMK
jgi:integrase